METTQTNQVNMITTVVEFSDANPAPVVSIPLYGTTLEIVKNNLETIAILNSVVTGSTKGITKDTNTLRRIMTQFGIQISAAIYAYAYSLIVPNETLAQSVDYQPTDFKRMTKSEIDDICANIQTIATANLAVLAPVGITAPVVAAFGIAINDYSASIQKPRNAIVSRTTAVTDLAELIRTTIDIQLGKVMDRLVSSIQFIQPSYYKSYNTARENIDLGHTFTKFRGTAVDTVGNPLQNATAVLTSTTDGSIIYNSISNNIGNYKNVTVKPDNYNTKYVCPGYITQDVADEHYAPGSETIHHIVFIAG